MVGSFQDLKQAMVITEYEAFHKREQRARLKRRADVDLVVEREGNEAAKGIEDLTKAQGCAKYVENEKRAKIAKGIARYVLQSTSGMDMDTKKDIFNRMIQHPSLKDLQNDKASTPCFADTLIKNILNTLQDLKWPQTKDEMFLKRSTMMMLMNSKNPEDAQGLNVKAVSKLLSIHRRNLYGVKSHLFQQIEKTSLSFATCHRSLQKNRIPEEMDYQELPVNGECAAWFAKAFAFENCHRANLSLDKSKYRVAWAIVTEDSTTLLGVHKQGLSNMRSKMDYQELPVNGECAAWFAKAFAFENCHRANLSLDKSKYRVAWAIVVEDSTTQLGVHKQGLPNMRSKVMTQGIPVLLSSQQ
ncbi:hypothetical protein L7F22_066210 [Adiantum nelumboides]|nr:hypothetical protein [Adiantum nelumboides]